MSKQNRFLCKFKTVLFLFCLFLTILKISSQKFDLKKHVIVYVSFTMPFHQMEKFEKVMNTNSRYMYFFRYIEELWKLSKKEAFESNLS